jgi:pyruvate kinase
MAAAVTTSTPSYRRTKIVATWGPAVSEANTLRNLIKVGVDVFRLNFSHANHRDMAEAVPLIRRLAQEEGRSVALMQDIQGPRIRTGRLIGGKSVQLQSGNMLTLTSDDIEGTAQAIPIRYDRLAQDLAVGQRILIADGTIVLRVTRVVEPEVTAIVEEGGTLSERKGVNLPDTIVSAGLTDKDRDDLTFGVQYGMDYVALSFVRRRDDILDCRSFIHQLGGSVPVIAKIENPEGITNLEEILAVSDGVMVARGDLGVELSPERVPLLQKHLIRRANQMGLPVITATQMLESMVERSSPTRAEASDVANAVLDGTDALMLSAETAIGRYPLESVQTMARIAMEAEQADTSGFTYPAQDQPHAMAMAARELAESLGADAIAVFTRGGNSAKVMSHQRPATPVYAFTDNPSVCQRLALWYGVTPILTQLSEDSTAMVTHGLQELRLRRMVAPGASVVVVGASPWVQGAPTNFVMMRTVPS